MTVEYFVVTESDILLFACAIGDSNPASSDHELAVKGDADRICAPPTFVQGLPWFSGGGASQLLSASEIGGGIEGGAGLHAAQRFVYHRPLRAGDELSIQNRLGESWEKRGRRGGALVFNEMITEYRDPIGRLYVTTNTVVVRSENVPI